MLKPVPIQTTGEDIEGANADTFWGPVGVRVEGMKDILLGALKFKRQVQGSTARRALTSYLSSPPSDLDIRSLEYPSHLLKLAVPGPNRRLKDFVDGLNRGEPSNSVMIDIELIDLCFDFRRSNPSIDRHRFAELAAHDLFFRSRDGHVISGRMFAPTRRLRRTDSFLGITQVVQHTKIGELLMPDLIAPRKFFAIVSECPDGDLPAQVFDPATLGVTPIVGIPAWRHFMARRKAEFAERGTVNSEEPETTRSAV